MCGIAGYIGKKQMGLPRIEEALRLMRNRGPDHQDYQSLLDRELNIYLLHSRLGIIDLEERSNQPFTIGHTTIIFNGEIYNYIELREELKKKGVAFRTESDTEVLLQYYLNYEEDCVQYFEGMWSFAIYDSNKRVLFLSRDRFGEKPLYMYHSNHGIYFGSEIKFIKAMSEEKPSVNYRHLLRYMVNGYKSLYKTDGTFFEGIKELSVATNLTIDAALNEREQRYWTPLHKPLERSLNQSIEGFKHHLLESIRIRLRADVPIAFCLSGGLDSSSLVSIAAKCFNYNVATFSIIDSDERYNERDNIQETLTDLDCEHTLIDVPRTHFFDRLTNLIEYHDTPISTISYYVHSLLSESISRQGFRVVCSGTGADELVTGYYDHFILYLYEMRHSPNYSMYLENWKQHILQYVRNPCLKNPQLYFENPELRDHIFLNNRLFSTYIKPEFHEPFTETTYCKSLLRNRMMNEMFHESTRVILHEDDLNSMRYSIENRSPYLDRRLFEFSYSIPTEHLIQNGYAKYILREAMKGIVNEKIRTDRRKVGFNASINSLIDLSKKDNQDYLLEDSPIFDYVKRDKIEELMSNNPMPNSLSKFLFYFINSKIFLECKG